VEAQRAAGIFMVAAAGNGGPNCHTITDPPGIYDALYTIGALNSSSDIIASFSSRGTVNTDNSGRRKPDLTGPGQNVRSSIKTSDTAYSNFSGTSMATPHVAGAVALLWSAEPSLRNNSDATETILNESAVPIAVAECDAGGVPNNTYGYGRLDAKAAVDVALLGGPTRTSIAGDDSAITVRFFAGSHRTYRLERKLNIPNAVWAPVVGAPDLTANADGELPMTDPDPADSPVFYRVRLIDFGSR
jgi:subtilisin family serine protease